MNVNLTLLKPIRILFFPFSLVYWLIIFVRNRLFDANLLKSGSFNLPIVCVGNLSVGGTGKSPMVEYLITLLKDSHKVATLSRGYKRKTAGYALANASTTALEIGDEPMQFHQKFRDIAVAVGEQRFEAIPQLLHDRPDTEVIILDDAFQHREVKAGLNILLTDCSNLYTRDWYLPTGDLRDEVSSAKRAHIIVVTKCPPDMKVADMEEIRQELAPASHQEVFFSTIRYGALKHIVHGSVLPLTDQLEVLLVTGIANPRPLKKFLDEHSKTYYEIGYSDHHIFTIDDLKDIKKRFEAIQWQQKIIVTTEKDAVRLQKFQQELGDLPLYVLPIEMKLLFNESIRFSNHIKSFIRDFNHFFPNYHEQKKQQKEK